MRVWASLAYRVLGEVTATTDPVQAALQFEKSIAGFAETKSQPDLALAFASYGRLYKELGKITEARDCLTRALEIFERIGVLHEPEKVRQELAALPAST